LEIIDKKIKGKSNRVTSFEEEIDVEGWKVKRFLYKLDNLK